MAKKGIWRKYRLVGDRLERSVSYCPVCGTGYVMAEHSDRLTCGRCGYTSFKTQRAS